MTDHTLSQEEIDALLRGEVSVSQDDVDLEPLVNVFQAVLDHVAPIVSPVAGQPFEAGKVVAEFLPWEELESQLISPLVAQFEFRGHVQGTQLSIADGSTQQQLRALSDEEPATILNKMALALAAGLEEQLGFPLDAELSTFAPLDPDGDRRVPWRGSQMCAVFNLSLQGPVTDVTWQEVWPHDLVQTVLGQLVPAPEPAAEPTGPQGEAPSPAVAPEAAPPPSQTSWTQPASAAAEGAAAGPPVSVSPAHFAPLGGTGPAEHMANIGIIMDVPLQVTVELGRKRMLVREVLDLGKGSLIELEKLAGEPVDVYVNGKLIAKGEVVVIDENFGVKVTSIVTPVERLQNLH